MRTTYEHFIKGEFVSSGSGEVFTSVDPATEEVIYEAALGTASDTDRAVRAATEAFPIWSSVTPTKRGKVLRRIGQVLEEHAEELALMEARDSGRLLSEMRGQLSALPEYFFYYAGLADKVHGDVLPPFTPGTFTYTLKEPLGVIGGIVPWNAPLSLAALKIAPALAAGNTVVIKPSEHTSATMLEVMALMADVGLPDGALNVVTGKGEVGASIAAHPGIAKISFTGGTETGRRVAQAAASHLAPVTMELGGKSPQVVFADADPGQVIDGLVNGVFKATGQACVAGSRAFIQAQIFDEVLDLLMERCRELRIGPPLDPASDLGPLCFDAHRAHVEHLVAEGKRQGAALRYGGDRPAGLDRGYYFEPTIFTDVSEEMEIVKREVFGPVLTLSRFESEEEAIRLANDTEFGLAGGIWTRDVARAHRMAGAVDAGIVWINQYRASTPLSPMGGFKASGWGKEGGYVGIEEFLRLKTVSLSTTLPSATFKSAGSDE